MARDRIVEEVRRNRERYAARLGFSLDAIYRDLKEREARGEYTTVRRAPRRPRQIKRTGS
jgi:hypothetical protein